MAKKAAAREPSQKEILRAIRRIRRDERGTELDLRREVIAILTTAGWKVIEQGENRRRFAGDILASRTELGRERRYTMVCVVEINDPKVQDYFSRFQNWVRQSKEPFTDFDEFWLVGYAYADDPMKNPRNNRHFRVLDLGELRALLAPPRRGAKSRARTKIGKAVEAKEKEITLAVAGLILQIGAKIEALQGDRPNSDEAIAVRNAHITEYERMLAELTHIQAMIAAFKAGTEQEAQVVRSLKTFADGVGSWWDKSHDTILTKTFDMGLFTTAVGICSMVGAGGKMAVAVSAVLVGGKPVAQALKGLIPKRFMAD
jgi:hypothetical protein